MSCKIENMMNMLYKLCWRADQSRTCASPRQHGQYYCKATCEVVDDAIQVLAGIGVVSDHRVVVTTSTSTRRPHCRRFRRVMVFNTALRSQRYR